MLEQLDLAQEIPKDRFKEIWPGLEIRLSGLQRGCRAAGIPVVIVFEGWDAAGKGTCVNRTVRGLDPRGYRVHPISAPNEEEKLRPFLWRFWTRLPEKGEIGIYDRSWYGRVLVARVEKSVPEAMWRSAFDQILSFERQLGDSGAVIIKFFLHIDREEQRRRFKKLEKKRSLAWKVGKAEWRQNKRYDEYSLSIEEMLSRTSTAQAPWTVVEATDRRFACVKIAETISGALEDALARAGAAAPAAAGSSEKSETRTSVILDRVDLLASLDDDAYEDALDKYQKRLFTLEHEIYIARVPVVILYEGWDASGKGGIIKRLTRGLDPRGYEVIPIGAPEGDEAAHHYLWRFWRALPKAGHITIFDRSWYGRVLVERVEGFCTRDEWMRAYREINEFEEQLTSFGSVLVKLWLHISKEEQLARFERRQKIEHKQWKITDDDWRNREKWDLYKQAVVDMLERTSTSSAPWTIVEANSKKSARIKALRTVVKALEGAVGERG